MKQKLCTIKIHSIVDIITNSSTELFCVVSAKNEDTVQRVIDKILKDCGCHVLEDIDEGLWVEPHRDDDDNEVEGQYDILYEQHAQPCDLIMRRIKETFEVIQEGE